MKKKGFTLTEVLVVVLIVAVLAGIAYPSYQASVWTARVGKFLPLGRHLVQQSQLYYEEQGSYPTTKEMDAFIPGEFSIQEEALPEIDQIAVSWENGEVSLYCANGEETPADCRLVGLSIKGKGWTDDLVLFFNARQDSQSTDDIFSHRIACVASRFLPAKENALTHKICRGLGGKLAEDSSVIYYID